MPRALSLGDVSFLKDALGSSGLGVALHLHDTCGAQSFSIECLREGVDHAAVRALVGGCLAARGLPAVRFSEDGLRFWVVP